MTTPLSLSGQGLPRRRGELAFDAPWQSTVFALAAAVIEHAFGGDREPFRQQLIKAIAAEPGRARLLGELDRRARSARAYPDRAIYALTKRDRARSTATCRIRLTCIRR